MLEQLKEMSQGQLVLCFAGTGSAFSKKNAQTSLIIAKGDTTILVDCGTTIPVELAKHNIPLTSFNYFHFTHSHADHVGGAEELFMLSRYVLKQKPKVIITEMYQGLLWEETLKGGCEHSETGLLRFSDFAEPVRPRWMKAQPREMYEITVDGINLIIFRTIHIPGFVSEWEQAFWSTGLLIDRKVLFTADTRFDPAIFEDLKEYMPGVEGIFHDCQLFDPGGVHATLSELNTLPTELKSKMHLTHYGDNYDQFDVASMGFQGFARAWTPYVF